MEFVAPTTVGTEALLAEELTALGAEGAEALRGAVRFRGPLRVGYRAALWSRIASRVLLVLARFPAPDKRALYDGARREVRWMDHLGPDERLAVDCVGRAEWLSNSHFAELVVKDAVVDAIRDATGRRPSVDPQEPDLRLHLYLYQGQATLSLDLAGEALHRRGLGRQTNDAPLKENLAAALLMHAGWPAAAAEGRPLVDPMCGAGTILLEAAWMARDVAPGLYRSRWGFQRWRGHQASVWASLVREAEERQRASARRPALLVGFDTAVPTVHTATQNAARGGVSDAMRLERRPLGEASPPEGEAGLVLTNPPYGQRLGEEDELGPLYAELGDVLRRRFLGWTAWIFTGSKALANRVGLKPARRIPLWNGPIECRLLCFPIAAAAPQGTAGPAWRRDPSERHPAGTAPDPSRAR